MDDLLPDYHSILNRMKNHFYQLLTVNGINDVRQTELHIAETLVPEPSSFEVDTSIGKMKRCTTPGIDQIPAELIQADGKTLCSVIHELLNSVWNTEG